MPEKVLRFRIGVMSLISEENALKVKPRKSWLTSASKSFIWERNSKVTRDNDNDPIFSSSHFRFIAWRHLCLNGHGVNAHFRRDEDHKSGPWSIHAICGLHYSFTL